MNQKLKKPKFSAAWLRFKFYDCHAFNPDDRKVHGICKVSDTGSAHWASSYTYIFCIFLPFLCVLILQSYYLMCLLSSWLTCSPQVW
jgi:hypothetical protein